MGIEHGAYCVGCCWGLMLIFVAGLIFAEKVLPFGHRLTPLFAVAFVAVAVAVGTWIAVAPSRPWR